MQWGSKIQSLRDGKDDPEIAFVVTENPGGLAAVAVHSDLKTEANIFNSRCSPHGKSSKFVNGIAV